MAEQFYQDLASVMASPPNTKLVTPSDTEDLPYVSTAISLDGAGVVTYHPMNGDTKGGDAVVSRNLAAGIQHAIRARRILASGTTATGIHVDW